MRVKQYVYYTLNLSESQGFDSQKKTRQAGQITSFQRLLSLLVFQLLVFPKSTRLIMSSNAGRGYTFSTLDGGNGIRL